MGAAIKTITVSTTVNLPIEKAWNIWNEPEHITRWYQATPEWHAPHAENNLETGGRFTTTMAAKDGSFSFDFSGVYTNVTEHKELAYTLDDGRQVSILFEAKEGQTTITETFEPEMQNSLDMQQRGWQAILDSYKQYAEGL
jgi:uncharacterized protein YndB with AHSA1/START domain